MDRTSDNYQKKYRQKQQDKGLTRFEIQIPTKIKEQFDALVEAAAEEYVKPFSKKKRAALARIQVFDEITQNIRHDFFEMKDKILSLKEEIKALSPNFFKMKIDSTPLPEAISALPNDATKLKPLLAKLYKGLQEAKSIAAEEKRRAKQFEALYNAANDYNDKLKTKLNLTNE